jgi:putative MATE family efflux protein
MELAALGACTSLFHLAFNAFRATTAATTSLVAASSETSNEEARQVTSISLQFGWWTGVVVLLTLLLAGNRALKSMGVDRMSPLYPAASDYLFTRCWAAPVVLLITVSEGAFRGYGNTVVPLTASLAAAFINLILDPILMFPLKMGVKGAAAATALSQVGAALVYAYHLFKRKMLPQKGPKFPRPKGVIRTILGANLSMMIKQGSLLFGWAFATARATRLGPTHVATHQVALSVWLVFALILDGTAVSAQVLMSRAFAQNDKRQVNSLTGYMVKFAVVQGLLSLLVLDAIDLSVLRFLTPDVAIQKMLHLVLPHLAWQQILVSLTLVIESLAAGANEFSFLAVGTTISTIIAMWQLSQQTSVDGIWMFGIGALFAGRLLTASLACWRAHWKLQKQTQENSLLT